MQVNASFSFITTNTPYPNNISIVSIVSIVSMSQRLIK